MRRQSKILGHLKANLGRCKGHHILEILKFSTVNWEAPSHGLSLREAELGSKSKLTKEITRFHPREDGVIVNLILDFEIFHSKLGNT